MGKIELLNNEQVELKNRILFQWQMGAEKVILFVITIKKIKPHMIY